jgi:hypothetical protein
MASCSASWRYILVFENDLLREIFEGKRQYLIEECRIVHNVWTFSGNIHMVG